jgi:hypothetical protein
VYEGKTLWSVSACGGIDLCYCLTPSPSLMGATVTRRCFLETFLSSIVRNTFGSPGSTDFVRPMSVLEPGLSHFLLPVNVSAWQMWRRQGMPSKRGPSHSKVHMVVEAIDEWFDYSKSGMIAGRREQGDQKAA